MEQVGLKTIALTLFLNLFFYFLLQLLFVMISHWLTVLKHKITVEFCDIKCVEIQVQPGDFPAKQQGNRPAEFESPHILCHRTQQ